VQFNKTQPDIARSTEPLVLPGQVTVLAREFECASLDASQLRLAHRSYGRAIRGKLNFVAHSPSEGKSQSSPKTMGYLSTTASKICTQSFRDTNSEVERVTTFDQGFPRCSILDSGKLKLELRGHHTSFRCSFDPRGGATTHCGPATLARTLPMGCTALRKAHK
jgi:hypothetical protein